MNAVQARTGGSASTPPLLLGLCQAAAIPAVVVAALVAPLLI